MHAYFDTSFLCLKAMFYSINLGILKSILEAYDEIVKYTIEIEILY